MQELTASELDQISGGDLGSAMVDGALYGGMIGLLVGGPAGMLAGAVDGAAAGMLMYGISIGATLLHQAF